MTGATLAGRNLLAGLRARREEVEAWLALGATPRRAVSDIRCCDPQNPGCQTQTVRPRWKISVQSAPVNRHVTRIGTRS